ncbi:uncharacterized protein LOC110111530 [Dendrobium catenatum]|uniref:Uncharacterized protein n=1 Tax=Dendrobium catenatum TaxID=906689 RepID=A0A2I0VRR8_9ASPA|nr:uncharacterized protein LOC110111530 [Dendrobium catenatum]PKU66106.1 hypothetical protein MA16_Dca026351 [Dendrobium catenatum]
MNRRIRSPCRRAAARTEERLQRFLKPGALARLRDSKICARSPRSLQISATRISLPVSPAAGAAATPIEGLEGEQIRFFASRICAPRILQRKKLAAAKYVFFAPPSPDPSDSVLDVLGVDLVAAH